MTNPGSSYSRNFSYFITAGFLTAFTVHLGIEFFVRNIYIYIYILVHGIKPSDVSNA